MVQQHPSTRVRSGVPMWAVAALGVLLLAIAAGGFFASRPVDPQSLFEKGIAAGTEGDAERVRSILKQMQSEVPEDARTTLLEGYANLREGRLLRARPLLEEAVQTADDDDLKGVALAYLGQCMRGEMRHQEAIDLLQSEVDGGLASGRVLSQLSSLYYDIGAVTSSLDVLQRFIEVEPQNPDPFRIRGMIYADLRQFENTVSDLQSFLKMEANGYANPTVGMKLLESLIELERYEEALKVAENCGPSADRETYRAIATFFTEPLEDAERVTREAVAQFGPYPGLMIARSRIEDAMGDPEKAYQSVRSGLERGAREVKLHQIAFMLAQKLGNDQQADLHAANVKALTELTDRYDQLVEEVGRDTTNAETRMVLAETAAELEWRNLARVWGSAALRMDENLTPRFATVVEGMEKPKPELVPTTGSTDDSEASATNADSVGNVSAEPADDGSDGGESEPVDENEAEQK